MQTCEGKTKTGGACRAPAGAGGLCFFHANPDRARNLGRIGGRKNRRVAVDLQVPDNMTTADLRNVQVQAIRLLLSGEMHAREASALAQLCNSLYRVIPTADLEARVAALEEQVVREEVETTMGHSNRSDRDGIVAAEKYARPEADDESSCSIDANTSLGTDSEDKTENASPGTSAESGETDEA